MVICAPHTVAFPVGELCLDNVRPVPLFVEQSRSHAPETMNCHLPLSVAHTPQRIEQAHIRHATGHGEGGGKQQQGSPRIFA